MRQTGKFHEVSSSSIQLYSASYRLSNPALGPFLQPGQRLPFLFLSSPATVDPSTLLFFCQPLQFFHSARYLFPFRSVCWLLPLFPRTLHPRHQRVRAVCPCLPLQGRPRASMSATSETGRSVRCFEAPRYGAELLSNCSWLGALKESCGRATRDDWKTVSDPGTGLASSHRRAASPDSVPLGGRNSEITE